MSDFVNTVSHALEVLKAGGMVVLVDDEHRENEGDLVMAAEFVTSQSINFMAKYGRGLICLPMAEELIQKLDLPLMTHKNRSPYQTAFTVSIEAATGVATGISAEDRAHTILTAIRADAKPEDLISPGHVFPLKAQKNGVLHRRGQTEGSVDLMKLAGLKPAAVICEIMNDDGTMSRMEDLKSFSEEHHLPLLSIQDIFNYRVQIEHLIHEEISTRIPLEDVGDFKMMLFKNDIDSFEHFTLFKPLQKAHQTPLVRIHSECLTGDLLGSLKCDCGPQLKSSLKLIAEQGGLLIYLRQEGRGIGLKNKLKAYVLQDQGLDTVEANENLGLPVDNRDYSLAYQILKHFGWDKIRLITNNPLKIDGLKMYGIAIEERVSIDISPNKENLNYLKTKKHKLGHFYCKNDIL
ncbi:MAG: 3,4-dihydroxy-2-butanone-4-phosphate synthase [Gammaproteobacteria bacterium]|nr:3,4-dihydroxy-2-butanone-4-phosphate synthase [Gammaproteobacteria bacterium]